jgi:hypothetical protein
VRADADVEAAVSAFGKWIADEVLAVDVVVGGKTESNYATHAFDLEGQGVTVAIERAG